MRKRLLVESVAVQSVTNAVASTDPITSAITGTVAIAVTVGVYGSDHHPD